SASNSAPDTSSTAVTISVPQDLQADLAKVWDKLTVTVGQTSTVSLTARNTSNVPVDRLVVTEPAQPGDGSDLDVNNPFSVADLTGLASCALPAGASAVQVDAWVEQAGVWSWTAGSAGPSCALPDGVDFADVGGLRFTFTGDITANGAPAQLKLALVQRSDAEVTITNTATAQTSRGAASSPVVSKSCDYKVTEPSLAVTVNKTFNPAGLPQGNHTTATLTATNASRGQPVIALTVGEPDLAGQDFQFVEFPSAINYPVGAEEGKVVYHFASGPDEEVAFASGVAPAGPSSAGVVTGFEVVFSSTDGPLSDNASVTVAVRLGTSGGAIGNRPNTAHATVSDGVHTAEGERTVSVQVVEPQLSSEMTKTILPPFTAVGPGETVITGLGGTVSSEGIGSIWVRPTSIVITDQIQPASGQREFWDGFDLVSIQPFQVPANTTVKVDVWNGSTWNVLTTAPATSDASYFSLSKSEIDSLLGGGAAGAAARQAVTGVRFSFDNPTDFQTSQTITPYIAYQARSVTRSGSPTGTNPGLPWTNTATVEGSIATDGGGSFGSGPGSGSVDGFIFVPGGCANPEDCIIGPPTDPKPLIVPTIALSKDWREVTVHAQSSELRISTLRWDTTPGVASVTLSDPVAADSTAVSETIFDAFDLIKILSVPYSDTFHTSGWALRYDSVTAVELYDGSAWVTPSCASSGDWMTPAGFRGCDLTAAEQASTIGLRIVVEPNDDARASATDPFAPAVGSGVTSAYSDPAHPELLKRNFDLQWRVRDRKRSDDSWVIRAATYNYRPDGVNLSESGVANRAGLTAVPLDSQLPTTNTQVEAIISITDLVPLVQLTKSFSPGSAVSAPLLIPGEPGTPQSDYPSTTLTLTATNQLSSNLAAKASYIRITEPAVADASGVASLALNQSDIDPASAKADPFTGVTALAADSFFDRFNVTGVTASASTPAQIDLAQTTVHLLRYNAGALSHTTTTADLLNTMTAADLADVIGISVTFQDTDPVANGGSITGGQWVRLTITAQARATFRVSGLEQRLAVNGVTDQVLNTAFAQSYDPVQFSTTLPSEPTRGYNGSFSPVASVFLHGGRLLARAGQTIALNTPNSLTEPNRANPITVTMSGDARSPSPYNDQSNLPATAVTFDDGPDNVDFWDNVAFTGWGTITAPTGADQVSLCAFGAFTSAPADWVCSTPAPLASAELPLTEAQYPLIQGLQVVFSKADGTALGNWWGYPVVAFQGVLRTDTLSGDPVTFPTTGTTTVTNTISVWSYNEPLETHSAKASAAASLSWQAGSRQLALGKVANYGVHTVYPGDTPSTSDVVPFALTVTNTGSGYLHLDSLDDQLPPGLHYSAVPSNR
ncbi:MAG: hypothetical protein LBL55_05470, partial [Propionibacteriaceae bacterium]|nr:hypothetical protein [Propionibacteriaceae bacterium]